MGCAQREVVHPVRTRLVVAPTITVDVRPLRSYLRECIAPLFSQRDKQAWVLFISDGDVFPEVIVSITVPVKVSPLFVVVREQIVLICIAVKISIGTALAALFGGFTEFLNAIITAWHQRVVAEEEERRQAWIQHYIAEGNYAEARALGWEGTEGLPEWKQYEMQQQAAQEAAIPTMMDLENL